MRNAALKAAAAIAVVFLSRSEPVVLAAGDVGAPVHASRSGGVPVVVELFTSEGCSSCPPADEVLASLEKSQPVVGAHVVPLEFHVDYWDGLGWPDPFASPSFTARQRAYGDRTYTPQAVVDGRTELVGSNVGGLQRAIGNASNRPHASIEMTVERKNASFDVSVRVGPLPKIGGAGAEATLLVALTQDRAVVRVPRGENAGRTLTHTAVVRELERAGTVGPSGGEMRVTLRPPAGVAEEQFRVVAFAQRTRDLEILGSATRALSR
jgi:hypothetical protein